VLPSGTTIFVGGQFDDFADAGAVPAAAGAEAWVEEAEVDGAESADGVLFSAPALPAEALQLPPSIFAFWSLWATSGEDFFPEVAPDFFCVDEDGDFAALFRKVWDCEVLDCEV
jgi:hypothetical protein